MVNTTPTRDVVTERKAYIQTRLASAQERANTFPTIHGYAFAWTPHTTITDIRVLPLSDLVVMTDRGLFDIHWSTGFSNTYLDAQDVLAGVLGLYKVRDQLFFPLNCHERDAEYIYNWEIRPEDASRLMYSSLLAMGLQEREIKEILEQIAATSHNPLTVQAAERALTEYRDYRWN